MKQRIKIKQLNELGEKGKKKLRKWWKPKNGDFAYDKLFPTNTLIFLYQDYYKAVYCVYGNENAELTKFDINEWGKITPLLSIGQLIEFLEDNSEHQFHIFRRTVDWKVIYEELHYGKILGGELCDALFEAVKEVLNDN